jgi:hypothetical protein
VQIRVLKIAGSVTFEFSRPIGFDFLVVSNAEERVFWELKPLSMHPAQILESHMFGVRVPAAFEDAARETMKEIAGYDGGGEPPVDRVVYGEVPSGYREVVRATPLLPGEKYCVFVFGEGFEKGGEYFFV